MSALDASTSDGGIDPRCPFHLLWAAAAEQSANSTAAESSGADSPARMLPASRVLCPEESSGSIGTGAISPAR